jgi:hypothetical protein
MLKEIESQILVSGIWIGGCCNLVYNAGFNFLCMSTNENHKGYDKVT